MELLNRKKVKNIVGRIVLLILFIAIIGSSISPSFASATEGDTDTETMPEEAVSDETAASDQPNRSIVASGTVGSGGASWTLDSDDVVQVEGGTIHGMPQSNPISPWNAHRASIKKIIFTEPVTAGSNLRGLFSNLEQLTAIEGLDLIDVSNVTSLRGTFLNLRNVTSLDVSNWDTSNVTDMDHLFQVYPRGGPPELEKLDISNWDTGNVVSMSEMFHGQSVLKELDVSNWDISNVVHIRSMFSNVSSVTKLDVSNWDTSNVVNMINMFASTSSLEEVDVSNWDTSNVKDMGWMFSNAHSLTGLDVSNWDTSNVIYMGGMFAFASSLEELDVSDWDTSNVTSMSGMFISASSLKELDVSNWDTSNVTTMQSMFEDATSLEELDVSNWDTSNVTSMHHMFTDTTSLRALALGDHFNFVLDWGDPELPDPPSGRWQNVANGTVTLPQGTHLLTADELMLHHNENPIKETWVWEVPVVTFDLNKGNINGVTADVRRGVPEGGAIGKKNMPLPVREGYDFIGWFDTRDKTGGTEFTAVTPVYESMTVYARWEKEATIPKPSPEGNENGSNNNENNNNENNEGYPPQTGDTMGLSFQAGLGLIIALVIGKVVVPRRRRS